MSSQDHDERKWTEGYRAAWLSMLGECLRRLGYDDPEAGKAAWIVEREGIVTKLREVCETFGDNDWPKDLHLADVIDKHLFAYIPEPYEDEEPDDGEEPDDA